MAQKKRRVGRVRATSIKAIRELEAGNLGQNQRRALKVVLSYPGHTDSEYVRIYYGHKYPNSPEASDFRKRRVELTKPIYGLVKVGPTRKCKITGKTATTWLPTKKARESANASSPS